jgi:outer membrane protein TolC
MKFKNTKFLLPLLMTFPLNVFSQELTLEKYLKEVEENNPTLVSSKTTIKGIEQRLGESKLIFKPSIYAQAQASIDKKPTSSVAAQGDRTDNSYGTVGLMQQFDFGMKAKLGYTLSHTKIYDASSSYLPVPDFNDSQVALELTQSLWRNFHGLETKSQATILESDALAKKATEEYKVTVMLSQAESVYWSLAQMQKMLVVQKENLDRAKRIKNWAEGRSSNGLGDKSDLLQSDANVKFREYELKTTEQQVRSLVRSFNALRNLNNEELVGKLELANSKTIKSLTLPINIKMRGDVKAAIEYEKLSKANLQSNIERNKPTFEVYGSYAVNGRDYDRGEAISNTFKTTHDTKALGLRFSAPLDFSSLSKNIDGYKQEQISAELSVKQKTFDQEREWSDLQAKFSDAKNNLELTEKILEAQKIKSSNERDRLTKGRTTTFQVLNFEQDYASSELSKIKAELEILSLYAQSKTFLGGNE